MKIQKFVFLLLSFLGMFSCSTLNSTTSSSKPVDSGPKPVLSFKTVWVQNTLSEKNNTFRKINRFSPVYDTKENKIILANSLDGLSSYNLFYTLSPTLENYDKKKTWTRKIQYGVEAPGSYQRGKLYVGGLDRNFLFDQWCGWTNQLEI